MKHYRWIALVLVLSVTLSGCGSLRFIRQITGHSGDLTPAGLFSSAVSSDSLVPFPSMPYERPEAAAVRAPFDAAARLADEGDDCDALIEALDEAFRTYDEFYTLDAIAMIRADADCSDADAQAEYAACEQLRAQVEQWLEQMLRACANSRLRRRLEKRNYFAPHELDYYEDSDDYNDETVALYRQESELVSAYRELLAEPTVTLDGAQVPLNDYLAGDITREEHDAAYNAYLAQINAEAADIFCSLIRVRRQLAEAAGYDSYEQYQYDCYGREYTPAEVDDYLADVRADLVPLRQTLLAQGEYDRLNYPAMTDAQTMGYVEKAMDRLGTPASDAFELMQEYALYDVEPRLSKAATSYTVYLYSYGVPYLFADTYGDVEDICTISHEFGHFVSACTTDGQSSALDLDETFSQGMEMLTLRAMQDILPPAQYADLARIKLLDVLDVYTVQAAYAAFEQAAYALRDDELNADTLNALSLACCERYGCTELGDEAARLYWTQVEHFFELPFYIISYCTSVDAAMQLYAAECDAAGEGWAAYQSLLQSASRPFFTALEQAGLESPLNDGRTAQILDTLRTQFPADCAVRAGFF